MEGALAPLVGYVASVLVALSLTMSHVARLRWVNLAGALFFSAYGVMVRAWPVFAVNLFIVGVNAWFLARMRLRKDFFTLLPIQGCDAFGRKFLLFHQPDIERFFPGFSVDEMEHRAGFFVLRNMHPAGIFFYRLAPSGEVEVKLDYVVPDYRDQQNAEFVYRILNERFSGKGHPRFVVRTGVRAHQRYLARHRFRPVEGEPGLFERPII